MTRSLTLSPALAGLLLKPESEPQDKFDDALRFVFGWFFSPFNRFFRWASEAYAASVGRVVRLRLAGMLIYVGLIGATVSMFQKVPGGFIPEQDQGYVIVSTELPPGRNLFETDEVVQRIGDLSGASRTRASNAAALFPVLDDAKERADRGATLTQIIKDLQTKLAQVDDALVFVIPPPSVPGIGTGGGVKMQIQDRGGNSLKELESMAGRVIGKAAESPSIVQPFSTFRTSMILTSWDGPTASRLKRKEPCVMKRATSCDCEHAAIGAGSCRSAR